MYYVSYQEKKIIYLLRLPPFSRIFCFPDGCQLLVLMMDETDFRLSHSALPQEAKRHEPSAFKA